MDVQPTSRFEGFQREQGVIHLGFLGQSRSGCSVSSQLSTRSNRVRTEFTFQVVICTADPVASRPSNQPTSDSADVSPSCGCRSGCVVFLVVTMIPMGAGAQVEALFRTARNARSTATPPAAAP